MLLKPPVTPTLVADIIRLHDCPYATLTLDTPHEARGTIRAEVIRSCIDEYPLRLVLTPSRMWGRLFVTGLIDKDDLPSNPDVWSSMALEAAITYRSWCDVGIDPRTGAAALSLSVRAGELERALEHAHRRLETLVPMLYAVMRVANPMDWDPDAEEPNRSDMPPRAADMTDAPSPQDTPTAAT